MSAKVDNELINLVHMMDSKGAKTKDICSSLNLSKLTVYRIKKAKDLEEYRVMTKRAGCITKKNSPKIKVTDSVFRSVKAMLDAGVSIANISSVCVLGRTTVRYISYCDSLDDYRNYSASCARESYQRAKSKTKTKSVVVSKQADDSYNETSLYKALREQNELLKSISAKMAFIVEQLA